MNYCGQHGLIHHKLSWIWNKLFIFSKNKISVTWPSDICVYNNITGNNCSVLWLQVSYFHTAVTLSWELSQLTSHICGAALGFASGLKASLQSHNIEEQSLLDTLIFWMTFSFSHQIVHLLVVLWCFDFFFLSGLSLCCYVTCLELSRDWAENKCTSTLGCLLSAVHNY